MTYKSSEQQLTAKRLLISMLMGVLAVAFIGAIVLQVFLETGGTNSYALLAESWLHGRLDTQGQCFDTDCATYNGRTYVVFPPMPAVIALPFIAIFGSGFGYFVALSAIGFAAIGRLWWKLAARASVSRDHIILITLLVLFATPLAHVVLRGDRIWFFAQVWGFLFSTAALFYALDKRNAWLAGLFIGMAFLSRQMTILYLPLLYVLLLDEAAPIFRIDRAAILRAMKLALGPLVGVTIYMIYNYVRFGSPLDTGYNLIFNVPSEAAEISRGFISARLHEIGIFDSDYLLFNIFYMFVAGPHVEFVGRYLTEMGGFDRNGASVFLVSPILLFAFLAPWNRQFLVGVVTCALIMAVTMFYVSNGYSQYSAQRYALDWLPILLLFLTRGLSSQLIPAASLLIAYSMFITLSMILIGGLDLG